MPEYASSIVPAITISVIAVLNGEMSLRGAIARMVVTAHGATRAVSQVDSLTARDHALLCSHPLGWMILCVEDWQMFTAEYREYMHSMDLLARVGR